jgi:hypothetical protein
LFFARKPRNDWFCFAVDATRFCPAPAIGGGLIDQKWIFQRERLRRTRLRAHRPGGGND